MSNVYFPINAHFYYYYYPMARHVMVQEMVAAVAAADKLPASQWRRWLRPEIAAATPTTPASMANVTKKPVAAFPIGKKIGEKCAGRSNPGPVCTNQTFRWPCTKIVPQTVLQLF